MAGYSGTPLAKKLGLKAGARVILDGMPGSVRAELESALAQCKLVRQPDGALDFIHLFVKGHSELQNKLSTYQPRMAPDGMLWVSWPKKKPGLPGGINENDVRQIGLDSGLVDVKVCAVDETWSGLKFVIRLKDRKTARR